MILIVAVFVFAVALLAVVLQFFSMFYSKPLQAAIRALIGLLILLVGSLAIPSLEGTVSLSLDWGALLKIDSQSITIKTSESSGYKFAWISITILLAILFFRVPSRND